MSEPVLTLDNEAPPQASKPYRDNSAVVRGIGIVLAITGLVALGVFALRQGWQTSQSTPTLVQLESAAASGPAGAPALRRVMLSTGGVGYFEHEAEVTGNADLDLPVRMDQIDDILKSIVVFDSNGGTGYVQLPSRAPLSDIFRGLPFGPDALESNAGLISALKGAEVAVRAGTSISGRIVSINAENMRADGDTTITRHRVGVMTATGLRQFVLEEASSISFSDPVLTRQIEQALAAVADRRDGQGRTLKIRAQGNGTRKVTIAYVVETPLWKSSYRATTLDARTARLQGWAILENVTGNDWSNVELSVVTGNPVTFRQALHATYYVNRPQVPVEVVGRILPRPDEGGVPAAADGIAEAYDAAPAPPPPPPAAAPAFMRAAPQAKSAPAPLQARATESVAQVIFRMPFPVSVMNGQSLAVPVVDKVVPGELVAVYQAETSPRHPLAALKLTNATGLSLPPGVLTLYRKDPAATSYVGDAQLSALPAAGSRMLGFALDQKVLVDRDDKVQQTISRATMVNGIFRASMVDQRTTVYTLKAAQNEDRRIIIEHPREPGWELVTPDPKAAEMTDIAYRIPVELKAGSVLRQTVTMQWARSEEQVMTDLGVDVMMAYAGNTNLTPAQRNAFNRMAGIKRDIGALQAQAQLEASARERVYQEQARIRENIGAVPAGSDIQARYLRSMGELEDQAETHKRNLDRLDQQLAGERQKLADYVSGLLL